MEQVKNPIINIKKILLINITLLILLISFLLRFYNNNFIIKADSKISTINNLLQEQYYKELSLNFPSVSDSQNLEIIFANPNDPKKHPITIIIDNKKFEKAKSPFKLPTLEIGTHNITFKYTNKDDIPRTLTIQFTIVPKSPVLNQKNKTLFYRPEPINITGKALAFSKIMIIINSKDVQYIPVNANGEWKFTIISPRTGNYNLLFFTYKDGVISKNYAKIQVKYDIQKQNINKIHNNDNANNTNIIETVLAKLKNLNNYRNYLYIGLVSILFFILIYIIFKIKKWLRKRWEQKEIIELITKQKPKKDIVKIIKKVEKKTIRNSNKIHKINTNNISKTKKSSKKNNDNKDNINKNILNKQIKTPHKLTKTTKKQSANNKNSKQHTQSNKAKKSKKAKKISKKINIKKKVLSKEEFLSMFKKTKDKG